MTRNRDGRRFAAHLHAAPLPSVTSAPSPALFVSVGTDGKYSFDRLIEWVDEWLSALGDARPPTLVQHGVSQPARFAHSRDFLAHESVVASIESASLIVTHGGPGTIFECWRCRKRPVVVPRLKALREAVDDHQTHFVTSQWILPRVWMVRTKADFVRMLSAISRCLPMGLLNERTEPPLTRTVAQFEAVISDLLRE
jgi:UDP-N-acetylglucosamine transferase subunit ALG13